MIWIKPCAAGEAYDSSGGGAIPPLRLPLKVKAANEKITVN